MARRQPFTNRLILCGLGVLADIAPRAAENTVCFTGHTGLRSRLRWVRSAWQPHGSGRRFAESHNL